MHLVVLLEEQNMTDCNYCMPTYLPSTAKAYSEQDLHVSSAKMFGTARVVI